MRFRPGVSGKEKNEQERHCANKESRELREPGEKVTLVAQGLPGDTEVSIDARIGDESDFQNISRARTDAAGMLKATVAVPAGAREGQEIVFAVETTMGVCAWFPTFSILVRDGLPGRPGASARKSEFEIGGQGSDRVHIMSRPQAHDLAVTILVDVSLSTDACFDDLRVLDMEKQALLVLAQISSTGRTAESC